jgi:hypothetical protein
MTQEEIRNERFRIELEIERLELELSRAKSKLKGLQNRCEHPDKKLLNSFRKYPHCPDCNLTILFDKNENSKPPG